jgi:YesN/AraC family two-component response regulator
VAFDVLMSDIIMPGGINGVDLARYRFGQPSGHGRCC